MALIKCPECGKEVSERAVSCPNCGCPIATVQKSKVVKIKMPPGEDLTILFAPTLTVSIGLSEVWSGKPGQTASFELDNPADVTIRLGTWGNSVSGTVEPGKKYALTQDMGIHMRATYHLTEVDVIDSE